MQKAMKWLKEKNIRFAFHNYKESGIDKATIEHWLKHLPLDKLVNMKSTTYRELGEDEKANIGNKNKAIALMIKYPSLIKRPVWDLGDEKFYLGWNETELIKLLEGKLHDHHLKK